MAIKFVRTPAQHREDGAEWDCVLPDGSVPAWIESDMVNVGSLAYREYRVGFYTVTFRSSLADRVFDVQDYPSARSALAAAKRHVRETLGLTP